MKAVKLGFIFAMAALMTLGLGSAAFAFHSGGVAHCDGCHTMHNSQDGIPYESHGHGGGGDVGTGHNSYLTVGTDPSSTCLNCHISIYQAMSSDGSVYSPGGDFWWMTQDTPGPRGAVNAAEHKGHNTIANDFGIVAEGTLTNGPSNGAVTYQSAWLGCNSCHDPHGKKNNNINPEPIIGSGSYGEAGTAYGNYRLLGGIGYDGGEQASGIAFVAGAPLAVGLHTYRGDTVPTPAGQGWDERDNNHVDYGSGMSEWCANCHSGFTAISSLEHRHPASNNAHLNGFGATYDSYVATGDLTGSNGTSYDRLVPFERGVESTANIATLDPASTNGPDTNSNVMCLTCHRAHASPWNDALRWDPQEELLADSPLLTDARGVHAYYGDDITTRYNEFQRSLCNKCHLQD